VITDDNHADALAILSLARAIEGKTVVLPVKAKKVKAPRKPSSMFTSAKPSKLQQDLCLEGG
jgi:hypothetical protein